MFYRKACARIVKKVGEDIRAYDLRKAFSSAASTAGLPESSVAALLEQRSCDDPETLRGAMQAIENRILEIVKAYPS